MAQLNETTPKALTQTFRCILCQTQFNIYWYSGVTQPETQSLFCFSCMEELKDVIEKHKQLKKDF